MPTSLYLPNVYSFSATTVCGYPRCISHVNRSLTPEYCVYQIMKRVPTETSNVAMESASLTNGFAIKTSIVTTKLMSATVVSALLFTAISIR